MNITEYISTGILEAYVLGELSEAERAEVEKNLLLFPELNIELAKVEEAQEKLLMQAAIRPSSTVKSSLFEKIDPAAVKAKEVTLYPSHNFWKFAAAASISMALISSYLAYNYWNKWKTASTELSNLITHNQQIASDYNQVNQRLDKLEDDLNVLDNPQFKRVIMKGTPNAPQAIASVYWNESTKEVYLRIQNMKELAQGNQYQLWAIIDGKPVDAGVFDGNVAGLLKMKQIGSGAAMFAVTIEPRGGKPNPTMETMQVAGSVEKS